MPLEENVAALTEAVATLTKIITKQTEILSSGAGAGSTSGSGKAADDAITAETVKKRFGAYLSAAKDEEEKGNRGKAMKAMAKNFDAAKPSEVPEKDWPNLLKLLGAYEKGKDPLDVFKAAEDDV